MSKVCDHTSVGILVWDKDKLLLIERKNFPFGFAPPAGHLDGDNFEEGARRELKEEVGLSATALKLVIKGKKDNKCRREDGNYHDWEIFEGKTSGQVVGSKDETKKVGWFSKEEIRSLAERTEEYLSGKIDDEVWKLSPGIEEVWFQWFKELKII